MMKYVNEEVLQDKVALILGQSVQEVKNTRLTEIIQELVKVIEDERSR